MLGCKFRLWCILFAELLTKDNGFPFLKEDRVLCAKPFQSLETVAWCSHSHVFWGFCSPRFLIPVFCNVVQEGAGESMSLGGNRKNSGVNHGFIPSHSSVMGQDSESQESLFSHWEIQILTVRQTFYPCFTLVSHCAIWSPLVSCGYWKLNSLKLNNTTIELFSLTSHISRAQYPHDITNWTMQATDISIISENSPDTTVL